MSSFGLGFSCALSEKNRVSEVSEKKIRNRNEFMYIDPALLSWIKNLLEVKLNTIAFCRNNLLRIFTFTIIFGLQNCLFQSENNFPITEAHSVYSDLREFLWIESSKEINDPAQLSPVAWSSFPSDQIGTLPISGHDLWIRFPDSSLSHFRNPILFIEIALEKIKVFHGNELVYDFEKTDYVFPHLIPLKREGSGYIYVKCKGKYQAYIGLDHSIKILEYHDALMELLSQNLLRLCLTPVLFFLSFIFIGLYFLRPEIKINLYFALLLLSSSLIEGTNGFLGYYFQSNSNLMASIQYLNYTICPVLLMLFLGEVFPPFFKNVFRILSGIHIILYIFYFIKHYDKEESFLCAEWDFIWWVIVEATFVLFSALYIIWRKQYKLNLISFGLLSLVVAGSHDSLVDMEILPYKFSIIHIGFWIGVSAFSYYVFKYYLDIIKSLDQYNQILISKNKELERLVAIDKDLILAKELQKSLLSDLEKGDQNLNIVSFNHSLHSIGGDYFDYVNDSMGNWGILICDVAGHGISSAVVAAMSKMAFTATSPYIQYPAKVFNSMNRNLYGKNRGMFITASYLYIDTESKVLSYVNAGHPVFFLIRKSSPYLLEYKTKGRPLGIFADSEYSVGKLSLEVGDRLFLFTDGIPDLNNPTLGAFGEERLRQLLWEHKEEEFKKYHELIQKEFRNYSRSWEHQDDDVSYILIEILD